MSLFKSPVGTDEGLHVWQAICRATSLTEAFQTLAIAVEQVSGHAAAIVQVDPSGRPRAWFASGDQGAGDETAPPDLADWLVLPMDGIPELRLLLRPLVEGDGDLAAAGIVRGQALCHRAMPLLETLYRCLDAEFRQRAMDAVLALTDREPHGKTLRPADLADALASMGLAEAWLWGVGTTSAEGILLATAGTGSGQGALAPAPPAWVEQPQGPVVVLATGLTWVPVFDRGRLLAYVAVRFPADWFEAQCQVAVECLQRLTRMAWLPAIIVSALSRLQGMTDPLPGEGADDGGAALRAVTQQAAKMTHDVRNKLNVVATGAYLLRMKVEGSADASVGQLLQQIEDNVHASSELMSEMLGMYRRSS